MVIPKELSSTNNVIYYSDPFFKLSSKMLVLWSCDLFLLLYMVITKALSSTNDVIYHSDPFFKLSSKILFVWSCDLSLMPYMVITRKLAVFWWSPTHLSWNWNVYERDPRILFICIWLYLVSINNYNYVYKVMILYIILPCFSIWVQKHYSDCHVTCSYCYIW